MTVRFSNQLVAELIQPFWAAWQAGEFMTDASAIAAYRNRGLAWVRQAGGVRPRRGRGLRGRYLSFGEREEIALGRAGGESIRFISRRLGRSPSTISRELARNSDARGAYRATTAYPLAYERASRPKPAKLVITLDPSCPVKSEEPLTPNHYVRSSGVRTAGTDLVNEDRAHSLSFQRHRRLCQINRNRFVMTRVNLFSARVFTKMRQ